MKNKVYFITVCAANSNYIQQLLLLSYSLELKRFPNPMVLVPSYSTIEEQLPDKKYIIKKVDIVKKEDIYHEKFVLKYMSTLSDNDSFFYIDPDHILNNIFEIPNLKGDSVWVSSEVRRLSEFIKKDELDKIKTIYNTISSDDLCFNTSLIYCNISYFNIIIPYWESVYNTLYSIVGHRHLEEIALSIAAKHYKFNVMGVDNIIQGNFNNENVNSKLFHYGGEYPKANYIKSVIINSNLTTEQKYQEIIKLLWSC